MPTHKDIWQFIKTHPRATRTDIANEFGMKTSYTHGVLRKMVADKQLLVSKVDPAVKRRGPKKLAYEVRTSKFTIPKVDGPRVVIPTITMKITEQDKADYLQAVSNLAKEANHNLMSLMVTLQRFKGMMYDY